MNDQDNLGNEDYKDLGIKGNQTSQIIDLELIEAQKLIEVGKFEKSLSILKNNQESKVFTEFEEININVIRSTALLRMGDFQEAFKYARKANELSQIKEDSQGIIDSLINMAMALCNLGDLDKSDEFLNKSEDLLKRIYSKSDLEYQKREAIIILTKGHINFYRGNAEEGIKYSQKGLEISKKIDDKFLIAKAYFLLGILNTYVDFDLDLATKYTNRSQKIAEEWQFDFLIALNLVTLGSIELLGGNLDQGLKYHEQALSKTSLKYLRLAIYNNIGNIFSQKGDLENALKYLKKGLNLAKEVKNTYILTSTIGSIIEILVIMDEIEEAENYLLKLKEICEKDKNEVADNQYLLCKALVLKTSPRIQKRAKAQKILEQIIQEGALSGENTIKALINLSELLIDELRMTNNIEILNELDLLISQLLNIAKKRNSFWILTETYLLQAKLSLLTLDLKKSRKLIAKAQQTAEKHGLNLLAGKISLEHDKLLKELHLWESLEESATIQERIKLANLTEQLENMQIKRGIEDLNLSEEQPVNILIITEGGNPLFSYSFVEENIFESHLFGGFLTTIDYFIKEVFSEGLDRAIFGDYTLLMEFIAPFYIVYIFRGDSFYALQRLTYFTNSLKNENSIWKTLIKNFEFNKSLKLDDIPNFERLFKDIFIEKSIILRKG